MKTRTLNREYKFSLFLLMGGALLLANPVWGVSDLLPDLLAWGMIWFGLRGFSELNGEMFLARKQALYLMGIGLAKTALWYVLQGSQIRSDTMLASTVIAAGEIWCGTLFFSRFFKGADAFARGADNESVYLKTENVRFLSLLFLWVRGLGTVLPQLTAIPDWLVQYGEIFDDDLYALFSELAAAETLLNLVLSVIVLIAAAVWLVSYLPYLGAFLKDASLSESLSGAFSKEDPLRDLKRRFSGLHMARLCFALAPFFLLDAHMDGFRFLPLGGFPLLFAAGCLFLNAFAREKRFNRHALLFAVCGAWFLLAEVYRRFFTVWDLRAFAEVDLLTEVLSALIILAGMMLLFYTWLSFSRETDALSASVKCGRLCLDGFPFLLLVLYAVVQTAIFALPLTVRELNTPRVLLVVLIWIFTNRRLAAFEENAKKQMMLYLPESE